MRGLPGSAALSPAPGPYVPLLGLQDAGACCTIGAAPMDEAEGPGGGERVPPSAAAASGNSEGASGKRFHGLSPVTLNPPAALSSDWLVPLQREDKAPNPRRLSCTEAFIGDWGKCTQC